MDYFLIVFTLYPFILSDQPEEPRNKSQERESFNPIMMKSVKAEGQSKRSMSAYFLWMDAEGREEVEGSGESSEV